MHIRPLRTCLVVAGALVLGTSAAPQATHWAFKPPVRPPVPAVKNASWVRNPVDSFILNRVEASRRAPSAGADRRTILRRITYDLTGLPPTPQETAAFVADRSPNAYDKVVDRLLRSPHYGERWAQHWLDVVRFAESNGYEHDLDRPQAWRYRDWVVAALNADMPYDRFVQMQVAGDLLAPGDFNAHIATGFLRAGPYHITGGNLDPAEMRQEWLTESVAGIGNGILGLTIGCARCHDHKLDPIPQADYYRLQAFFAATTNDDQKRATDAEKKQYDDAVKAVEARQKPIQAQIDAIEKPYRETLRVEKMAKLPPEYKAALAVEASKRSAEQKKLAGEAGTLLNISWDEVVNALSSDDRAKRAGLRQQLFALDRELPDPLPEAQGVGEVVEPVPAMYVLRRGDVHNRGQAVQAGFPTCVAQDVPDRELGTATGRIALAKWLTAPENPLPSRVIVNRLWAYLFGRGIVSTPNDFGRKGAPPTNQALLDWLACEFERPAASGERQTAGQSWSLKRMIRLLVTSNTYRQACLHDETKAAVDPENRLLWRMNRKRLDAEEVRDSILAIAGTLNLEMGGPSIRVPLEPEVYDTIFTESEPDNLWPATPDPRQHTRRSLYLFRKRNVRLPMMVVFDQPDMMSSCAARGQTVHALQALTLVNSEFMRQQSNQVAKRIIAEVPGSPSRESRASLRSRESRKSLYTAHSANSADSARIRRLFDLALGRPPRPDELQATKRFLADQSRLTTPVQAMADFCLATLNLNEFVFLR